jgi:hypothetical protein
MTDAELAARRYARLRKSINRKRRSAYKRITEDEARQAARAAAVERRERSQAAPPVADGFDLRTGDCRIVLSDIEDNSVPLILTDPPYGNAAEPLYEWLARFAARVLIPGGSLICYTGNALRRRDERIFDQHLSWHWMAVMLHDSSQRMFGPNVIVQHKPILWYVKERRSGRTMVPDVVRSKRDKSEHGWAQGDGGVEQWIHMLTEPEETIVDPFAGTATMGSHCLRVRAPIDRRRHRAGRDRDGGAGRGLTARARATTPAWAAFRVWPVVGGGQRLTGL